MTAFLALAVAGLLLSVFNLRARIGQFPGERQPRSVVEFFVGVRPLLGFDPAVTSVSSPGRGRSLI